MRRVFICLVVLLLLTGCAKQEEVACCIAQAELTMLQSDLQVAGEESLALQANLAMWYNQNLVQENDKDFRSAYNTILFYTDGIMGSLEIPGRQIHLPIYHGTDGEKGIGHDPGTAFPIGGTGNHPVLVTNELPVPAPGEIFVIHILGERLTYQVVAVRDVPDTTAVSEVDYCSLILGDGTQVLAVRQNA